MQLRAVFFNLYEHYRNVQLSFIETAIGVNIFFVTFLHFRLRLYDTTYIATINIDCKFDLVFVFFMFFNSSCRTLQVKPWNNTSAVLNKYTTNRFYVGPRRLCHIGIYYYCNNNLCATLENRPKRINANILIGFVCGFFQFLISPPCTAHIIVRAV